MLFLQARRLYTHLGVTCLAFVSGDAGMSEQQVAQRLASNRYSADEIFDAIT